MDIIKFLDGFTNESLLNEKPSRRDMFWTLGSLGKKAVLSAIPFGLATMPNKTFAQDSGSDPVSALQLALTLEYLEGEFYDLTSRIRIVYFLLLIKMGNVLSPHI